MFLFFFLQNGHEKNQTKKNEQTKCWEIRLARHINSDCTIGRWTQLGETFPKDTINGLTNETEETRKKHKLCVVTAKMGLHAVRLASIFLLLPVALPASQQQTSKFLFCFLPFSLCVGSHSERPLTLSCMSKRVQSDPAMTSTQTKAKHGNAFIFTFDLSAARFLAHFLPPAAVTQERAKWDGRSRVSESERKEQHRKIELGVMLKCKATGGPPLNPLENWRSGLSLTLSKRARDETPMHRDRCQDMMSLNPLSRYHWQVLPEKDESKRLA